jgi:hypothetical protein
MIANLYVVKCDEKPIELAIIFKYPISKGFDEDETYHYFTRIFSLANTCVNLDMSISTV